MSVLHAISHCKARGNAWRLRLGRLWMVFGFATLDPDDVQDYYGRRWGVEISHTARSVQVKRFLWYFGIRLAMGVK